MEFDENVCLDEKGNRVLIFSGKFKEEMRKYTSRGYRPLSARVNHILFWRQDDYQYEAKIVLPLLELNKLE